MASLTYFASLLFFIASIRALRSSLLRAISFSFSSLLMFARLGAGGTGAGGLESDMELRGDAAGTGTETFAGLVGGALGAGAGAAGFGFGFGTSFGAR